MMAASEADDMGVSEADHAEPFAITVTFDLVEGRFGAFHRLVCENAALSVEREPGCLRFDVLVPQEGGENQIFLYEIYASRADFSGHLTADHYIRFDTATRDMVAKKTVTTFTVIENAKPLPVR